MLERNSWGREWLDFHDATGRLSAIPTDWTDRAEPDPFVVVAAGRCHLRFEDLLRLVDMVAQVCKGKDAAYAKRTMPHKLPNSVAVRCRTPLDNAVSRA